MTRHEQNLQSNHPSVELQAFYDGLCILCRFEIESYRKRRGADQIEWIDISNPAFRAENYGLDPVKVNQVFHAKNQTGKIFSGIEGFIQVWSKIPSLTPLYVLSQIPGALPILKIGYWCFAKLRPHLPQYRRSKCETERCQK